MLLVDTSVWVDHLSRGDSHLQELLRNGEVLVHPFVIGELACGNLRQRRKVLALLDALPSATVATHEEVLAFLDSHRLYGKGLGYVDIHLLASARLSHVKLWTRDKPLMAAAARLKLAYRDGRVTH
ncbi:MAG TPA: type II toxin-antitoxin system VapC family toxin [Lentisphaerae bacterium]|nr:type II toxin-antitoxin system VapC family toxin [Lentisphaerota bacterium]